jgi:cytochrome c-type biogenesis protein CcmF
MKKPHIERFVTYDLYISPLDRVGNDPASRALWLSKGESRKVGQVTYTFEDFEVQGMGTANMRIVARLIAQIGGRSVPVRPAIVVTGAGQQHVPDYMPGGATVSVVSVDPNQGRVALDVPGLAPANSDDILAVEVSTKPLINLVWIGAIVMLGSAFLSMLRRILDLKSRPAAVVKQEGAAA